MSQNKTLEERFKVLLNTMYNRFVEFDKAYENSDDRREKFSKKVMPVLEKYDSDGPEFKKLAKEYITLFSIHNTEVSYAATKFLITADNYKNLVGDLPKEMEKAYNKVKAQEYKSTFSIENGEFVRNVDEELPEMPDEEYEYLFRLIGSRFKDI